MNANAQQWLLPEEGEHVEFQGFPSGMFGTYVPTEHVARSVCAFLNSTGGRILLGVGRKGEQFGLSDAPSWQAALEKQLPRLISPHALWIITPFQANGKKFLVVEVPEGSEKPYVTRGAIYLRHGARNLPASRNEISVLIQKTWPPASAGSVKFWLALTTKIWTSNWSASQLGWR